MLMMVACNSQQQEKMSFILEVNCRGMSCRTVNGIEKHEVVSKGKKFEASWRRFSLEFRHESQSRLLFALVQSGHDYQVGSIKCSPLTTQKLVSVDVSSQIKSLTRHHKYGNYEQYGIFASTKSQPESMLFDNRQKDILGADDLSLTLQRSREEHQSRSSQKNDTIMLCDSDADDEIFDGNLESAIMASMRDNHPPATSCSKGNSEDEDLRRAIELSLKDAQR
jgi:hypothetical protein